MMKEESKLPLAASEFIRLIESGAYRELKKTESLLKGAKENLRKKLEHSPSKRHEFPTANMVAKFVPKKVWEIDHVSLIEELFCYLRPEHVLSIVRLDKSLLTDDLKEMLSKYQLPAHYYVRPTLNKVGKELVGKFDYQFDQVEEKELAAMIGVLSQRFKKLEENHEKIKNTIMRCPELQSKKKITTPYGSISLLPKQVMWNQIHVYNDFGEDFFIQHGKVNSSKLEEFVQLGIIPKSLIDDHRTLIDIRLDFIVMSLDDEAKVFDMLQQKRQQISQRKLV